MRRRLLLLSLLIVVVHCALQAQPATGIVVPRIATKADTAQQYALYLPTGYTPTKKYPAVIFLDPSAIGRAPVNLYKAIAERYGIIMVGSWNSKNFNAEASELSVVAIYNELATQYSMDESRVWLAGFSGGARMASAFADNYPVIRGVIACGAGFAGDRSPELRKEIPFVGIVGDEDMNYEEMLEVSDALKTAGREQLLQVFKGGHTWAPVKDMELALNWLLKCDTVPQELAATAIHSIAKTKDTGLLYQAWKEAHELRKIKGCTVAADSLLHLLEKDKRFASDRQSYEQSIADQRQYMNETGLLYTQAVQVTDDMEINHSLWEKQYSILQKRFKSKDPYVLLATTRAFDYSWRICSERFFQMIELRLYKQAYKSALIMSVYDPPQSNAQYLLAKAAAGLHQRKLCLQHLKAALKKGTLNKDRVATDTLLIEALGKEKIAELLEASK